MSSMVPKEKENMSTIYILKNKINQKCYIGLTTQKLNTRWQQHCSEARGNSQYAIHKAIRKYGVDCWDVEILEEIEDEFLEIREQYWIKFYESFGKKGYNLTSGGERNKEISLELRQKISKANKGRIHTEESRKKKSLASTGRKMSQETKDILSKKNTGNKYCLGKIHSEETKSKMREKRKLQIIGEETKQKMAEIKKGKIAAYDLIEKKHILIDKDIYEKNKDRYEGRTKNRIAVYDLENNLYLTINKELFYSNRDRYVGPRSTKIPSINSIQ